MAIERVYDRGYEIATGLLGWGHLDADTAPLPDIFQALQGKLEFAKASTPKAKEKPQPSPQEQSQQLGAFLDGLM